MGWNPSRDDLGTTFMVLGIVSKPWSHTFNSLHLVSRNKGKSLSGSWCDRSLKGQRVSWIALDALQDQDPNTRYSRDEPVRRSIFWNDWIPIFIQALGDVKNHECVRDSQEQDSYGEVFPRADPIEIPRVIRRTQY